MTVVSSCCELPLHAFPLNAEDPAIMAREGVIGCLGEEIPKSCVAVSCTGGEEIACWGEGCTEDG
jgi:hypothetical protein